MHKLGSETEHVLFWELQELLASRFWERCRQWVKPEKGDSNQIRKEGVLEQSKELG